MNNLKQLEKLKKIHRLIQNECTGTPSELANKMHISNRQLYLMIERLKEMDAPIIYNRKTKNYSYSHNYELKIEISIQILVEDRLMNIYAGESLCNYITTLQGNCSKPNYLCYIKTKLDVVG